VIWHNDLYQIEKYLYELFTNIAMAGKSLEGLFINADSGLDSQEFHNTLKLSSNFLGEEQLQIQIEHVSL
jgi:hypothetical protein